MTSRSTFRRRARTFASLALLLCAGCASTPEVYLAPAVQDAELRDGESVEARALVSWRGVYERDEGPELYFRVRVENPRPVPFVLAPAEFELLDAALVAFAPARVAGMPESVPPGGDATFDLAFAPPAGRALDELDLSLLNLRVRFQSGRWNWNPTFERLAAVYANPYFYDPYWCSPWHLHAGFVWH